MEESPMSKPIKVTDETFDAEVVNATGVTLVDFSARWCGPCRLLAPVIDRLASEYEGRARIATLDVDANPETAGAFQILGIPALLIFRDGAVAERLVGYQAGKTLAARLDAVIALPGGARG
jgi:thioredoxin 1